MSIRRHPLEIGRELDAQRLDVACGQSPRNPEAAKSLVVGIDDTYVKHRERLTARQFQVTAGRVERNGKLGARFVFVSSNSSWSASLFDGFLLQQGMKGSTSKVRIGEWNNFLIKADGARILVTLNGQPVNDYQSPRQQTGYIALQVHDFLSRTQFRNLQINKLP